MAQGGGCGAAACGYATERGGGWEGGGGGVQKKLKEKKLALSSSGGVGEMSTRDASSKEGDNSMKPRLNHVQSTTRETTTNGGPEVHPQSQSCTTKKSSKNSSGKECDDTDDTVSRVAESVHVETGSSSD